MIGRAASSTIPVLWWISQALSDGHGGTKVQELKVVEHVVCEIPVW